MKAQDPQRSDVQAAAEATAFQGSRCSPTLGFSFPTEGQAKPGLADSGGSVMSPQGLAAQAPCTALLPGTRGRSNGLPLMPASPL